MNIIGIICEYNPFHTGHKYQIDKIKSEIDNPYIISLMSGNFVQRGDCAILDKHTRAKIALNNGANLILELPCFFSTQVAPIFATGSISILNSLNCVNYLCFGSETNNIDTLQKNARIIIQDEKQRLNTIKQSLKTGKSFIKSYSTSLSELPNTSNDILAIEYIKAIIQSNSSIIPHSIQRIGSSYNDTELSNIYSSATSIRHNIKNSDNFERICQFLPQNSLAYFDKKYIKFDEDFYNYIKYSIIKQQNKLENIFEISEGLENLIIKNAKISNNLNELIKLTKSKRYTYTRIRRILFNILLDIRKKDIDTIKSNNYTIPYIKILGFDDKGREILKKIKKNAQIDIINKLSAYKPKDEYSNLFFKKEIMATQIYNIDKKSYYFDDFTTSPIYKK